MLRPSLGGGGLLQTHTHSELGFQIADDESSSSIFAEVVTFHVSPAGRDAFTAALTVRLRPDNVAHPRSLLLELTDDSDLLFYHSLMLGEADFHTLKAEQRIRVDFQSFPAQLVELFRRCVTEESNSAPRCGTEIAAIVGSAGAANGAATTSSTGGGGLRLLAHLDCSSSGDSVLSIIESNQFRELTHIALRLRQGTDEAIKQHLAGKLKSCRTEHADLSERLRENEEQLGQARRLVDELNARARVVGEERQHLERSLETTHQRELAELRQEQARALADQQRNLTDERTRLETELRQNLATALARATAAERLSEDLQQRQQSLTSSGRSCQERLEVVEAQLRDSGHETQSLREQLKNLELLKYQHERELGELRVQLAGYREQLSAKEQLVATQAAQIEQGSAQRRGLEEALSSSKQQVNTLEEKFALSAQEITKGNQIIQNLHSNTKQLKAKLKSKTSDIERQEKAYLELGRADELNKHVLEEKENELTRGRERECRLQEQIDELKSKLAGAHEVLKSNQDVIEYLNKQLTERDLKGISGVSALLRTPGSAYAESGLGDVALLGGRLAASGGGGASIGNRTLASTTDNLKFCGLGSVTNGNAGIGLSAGISNSGTLPFSSSPPRMNGGVSLPLPAPTQPSGPSSLDSMGLLAVGASPPLLSNELGTDTGVLRGPVAYRSPGKASPPAIQSLSIA